MLEMSKSFPLQFILLVPQWYRGVSMLSCKVQLFCWGLIVQRDLHRATHTSGVTAQCIYVSLVVGMIVLVTFARPGLTETAGAVWTVHRG